MTIYRMERDGRFPARRQLGENSVAWLEDDVMAWVRDRPTANGCTIRARSLRSTSHTATPRRTISRKSPRGEQIGLPLENLRSPRMTVEAK